ncbi:putative cyclin-dependent protein [Paratrimastix pyriformis]|uniref:Cyclin-dependent protein n=1 Tax=Paratrimastix pyriformis TaxID=342808 RepID=A0ABQ8UUG2_9EUKA|nr:putative cyclin-dependent protein [Paratrimastix pyriformis]
MQQNSAPSLTQPASVDIYRVLAGVLTKLVMRNDAMAQGRSAPIEPSPFNALTPPEISIEEYLGRLLKYMACSEACTILALIYIDRVIQFNNQSFVLTSLNIHRLLITSMVVAAKFFDDRYYTNLYYAQVGGISVAELNTMELDFLFLINFSLHVSEDHYRRYFSELKKHAASRHAAIPAPVPQWAVVPTSARRPSSARHPMEIEAAPAGSGFAQPQQAGPLGGTPQATGQSSPISVQQQTPPVSATGPVGTLVYAHAPAGAPVYAAPLLTAPTGYPVNVMLGYPMGGAPLAKAQAQAQAPAPYGAKPYASYPVPYMGMPMSVAPMQPQSPQQSQ